MADARRLMALGCASSLAVEIAAQIDAGVAGVTITAAEVSFTPAGDIEATDVQAAIEELDTEKTSS